MFVNKISYFDLEFPSKLLKEFCIQGKYNSLKEVLQSLDLDNSGEVIKEIERQELLEEIRQIRDPQESF